MLLVDCLRSRLHYHIFHLIIGLLLVSGVAIKASATTLIAPISKNASLAKASPLNTSPANVPLKPAVVAVSVQSQPIYPTNQLLYDEYRWGVLGYYGQTLSNPLGDIFIGRVRRWPEQIQSIEVAHTLSSANWFRCLVSPIVGIVQLAAVGTVREGSKESTIFEFDPYIAFRWANLPWNRILTTSFGFGEGVSYASATPSLERKSSTHTKRFLNFLMFEATFALPKEPKWQVVTRIHHRSGAYGLYHAGNTGSNDICLGVRYLFD